MESAKMTQHKTSEKTKEKRLEILRIAADVIGKEGSSQATLEEIADRAGMTRAGLLYYFGSKRNLLSEVIKIRDHYDFQTHKAEPLPSDGDEMIDHLIATVRANEKRPGIVRTFSVLSVEALQEGNPGTGYFTDRYDQLRTAITAGLTDLARKRGLVPAPGEAGKAASAILAVMDGLQIQWLLAPEHAPLAENTEFAIRAIVDSLLAHSAKV